MPVVPMASEEAYPSFAWEVLWVIFVLVLVVAAILWLLRLLARRGRGFWASRSMRHLGGMALGTNKSIQVVEWNGRIYVLGVGDDVTLIDAIRDPETVAALLEALDEADASRPVRLPAWAERFLRRSADMPSDPARRTGQAPGETFEQSLQRRLRELSERRARLEQLLQDHSKDDRMDRP
ncbi:MAG TPA: flagellar biosynthetic protein FliO [Paenibacillaceae bacterium]